MIIIHKGLIALLIAFTLAISLLILLFQFFALTIVLASCKQKNLSFLIVGSFEYNKFFSLSAYSFGCIMFMCSRLSTRLIPIALHNTYSMVKAVDDFPSPLSPPINQTVGLLALILFITKVYNNFSVISFSPSPLNGLYLMQKS